MKRPPKTRNIEWLRRRIGCEPTPLAIAGRDNVWAPVRELPEPER